MHQWNIIDVHRFFQTTQFIELSVQGRFTLQAGVVQRQTGTECLGTGNLQFPVTRIERQASPYQETVAFRR